MDHGAGKNRRPKGAILVMDDDQLIRTLATGVVEHLGFAATTCSDGAEAIALYRKASEAGTPFHAALLDLEIPGGMGGQETAREILAMDPEAHLVLSTDNGEFAAIIDLASYGFCCVTRSRHLLPQISKVLAHLASLIKVTKLQTRPL